MPVQPDFYTPMIGFCWKQPFPPGKKRLFVKTVQHPTKPKKRQVLWLSVTDGEQGQHKSASKIVVSSPELVIGDATYIYMARGKNGEYERAVAACRSDAKMSGAYRTDDGQVAACVRVGMKQCELNIEFDQSVLRINRVVASA